MLGLSPRLLVSNAASERLNGGSDQEPVHCGVLCTRPRLQPQESA